MKKIIIKVGGSLLFNQNLEFNIEKVEAFSRMIKTDSTYEIPVIICGGGLIARKYINAYRKIRKNEAICDIIGIKISRINAEILIGALGESAYPVIPKTIEDLAKALITEKIIVMGGLQPGQSTTSVALEVAEYSNADHVVILTDVKGLYDKDPKKFEDAKLLEQVNPEYLQRIILNQIPKQQALAGEYRIFDLTSLQILNRSNLKVTIMSGQNLDEFKKFLKGQKEVIGTYIGKLN